MLPPDPPATRPAADYDATIAAGEDAQQAKAEAKIHEMADQTDQGSTPLAGSDPDRPDPA